MANGGFMEVRGTGGDQRGRVLLVDDDPAYGEYVRRVLTSGGFEVSHQPDAESALARVRAERWDLMISDIRLPGMNGLELLERVRGAAPDLPVVILTGHASVDHAVSALRGAASEFLQKPVTGAELVTKAAELIEASRAARDEPAAGTRAGPAGTGADYGGALPRPRPAADPRPAIPDDSARGRSAPPPR